MKDVTATARLGGTVIAHTTHGRLVEGNVYFPADDVSTEAFTPSALTTVCPWKGVARYRHVSAGNTTVKNGAWTYPLPLPFAWFIRRQIAFEAHSGITITTD